MAVRPPVQNILGLSRGHREPALPRHHGPLDGIGALVWPGPTILGVPIFVAWYLLFRGIFDVVIALSISDRKGWWLILLSGIVSIALGAWAIGNPDRSVLLLVTIVGVYAVFHGVAELMAGFQLHALRQEVEGS